MKSKWTPAGALARAKRRRSPWRILLVPLGFACSIGIFLLLTDLTRRVQIFLAPDDAFFCTPTHLSSIILLLALIVLSIPIGFITANLLAWMIPPVRAALDRADAHAGGSFAKASAGLVKITAVFALVVLPIYMAAIGAKTCLSDSRIYYQSVALAPVQAYAMSRVVALQPRCVRTSRGGWDFEFNLIMTDGAAFDLAVAGPWFYAALDRIWAVLPAVPSDNSRIARDCPLEIRTRISR